MSKHNGKNKSFPSVNEEKDSKSNRKRFSKRILTISAIVLILLLLFWLFIAEDIGAWDGWGNP